MDEFHHTLIDSRKELLNDPIHIPVYKNVAEGGCGVIGTVSSVPIEGRYLLQPLNQMHNRGNGKGGGIAAVGLSHEQLGVPKSVLEQDYLMQVAYLDPASRKKIEIECIDPHLNVEYAEKVPAIKDHAKIGLEKEPPHVWRYFVRADEDALNTFIETFNLEALEPRRAEDEFIFRNSFALNKKYYASLDNKKAFVVSHGKNMMVLKIVGYAEQVLKYYQLEHIEAHVWIGHQRYPTKGKIWHPGGSHPFIGLHDALIHNGDFANYHSITEYLRQRNIYPLFLTDTEVAVLYWDLLTRMYQYPVEYAIEAIAPTTERDYEMLPEEKKEIYQAIQTTHIHGSPDGPWFFIIARNDPYKKQIQLIGITDTAMLRPQVFALQERDAKIGIIASEKQAIDVMLQQLAKDDERFYPMADIYWYARGGSYTDGGAFVFTIDQEGTFTCVDKFGNQISTGAPQNHDNRRIQSNPKYFSVENQKLFKKLKPAELFTHITENMCKREFEELHLFLKNLEQYAHKGDEEKSYAIKTLNLLIDRRFNTGKRKRSDLIPAIEETLFNIFGSMPSIDSNSPSEYRLINWEKRNKLKAPLTLNQTLVIDVCDFSPEGENGTCQFLKKAYMLGWRKFIAYNFRGQRNFGAGLVARDGVRIDVYGSVGDCFAAFADGPEFYVHGSTQDSVGYCFKSGKLVVFGDAGKAFEYGAKGGVAFILGDVIDRPLINAVGSATAVINGTCKDYMSESCMAARGFTILNGITFDEHGRILEQESPYQGGNLFSLAVAGAVYLRDPRKKIGEDQLNGGKIDPINEEDWKRILPLLKENERLFGIEVDALLTVDGIAQTPQHIYRKVVPVEVAALMKYERGF
jgi:glutamate synthase domain-containing protein 1/glutamate synthase domain-containing protein 3